MHHMLDAARESVSFAKACDRKDLNGNRQLVLALVKEFEIVGETATQVSVRTHRESRQMPWRQIVGMRNRLIYAYFDINMDVVWNTVQQDLPGLIAQLDRTIPTKP